MQLFIAARIYAPSRFYLIRLYVKKTCGKKPSCNTNSLENKYSNDFFFV